MQNYVLNIYLTTGGTASITFENIPDIEGLKAQIKTQLNQTDNEFFIATNNSVISVIRDKIIGYSIDQR